MSACVKMTATAIVFFSVSGVSVALAQGGLCGEDTVVQRVNVDIDIVSGQFGNNSLKWEVDSPVRDQVKPRFVASSGFDGKQRFWWDLTDDQPPKKGKFQTLLLKLFKSGWAFDKISGPSWEMDGGRCAVKLKFEASAVWDAEVS